MTAARKIAGYGWRRDLPDPRDHVYAAPIAALPRPTPPRFSLVPELQAPYNQLDLGACTFNAIAGACEFIMRGEDASKAFTPSRLAGYYDERVIEGTVGYDSGAQLRDGIKVAARGVGHESLWTYDTSRFTEKPSDAYYQDAAKHPAPSYARVVQSLSQLRGSLLARHPVVFGFTVYESFESDEVAKTGVVPMPGQDEQILGGHAVMLAGYDDPSQRFIVRNSWGVEWGQGGYFTMPYAYVLNPGLAADFWAIFRVKE